MPKGFQNCYAEPAKAGSYPELQCIVGRAYFAQDPKSEYSSSFIGDYETARGVEESRSLRFKKIELIGSKITPEEQGLTLREELLAERLRLITSFWYLFKPSYRRRVFEINSELSQLNKFGVKAEWRRRRRQEVEQLLIDSKNVLTESRNLVEKFYAEDSSSAQS